MNPVKELLLSGSDDMVDPVAKKTILEWDNEQPKAIQILKTLDFCINGSLVPGLVIQLLQQEFNSACVKENVTRDKMFKQAVWRTE